MSKEGVVAAVARAAVLAVLVGCGGVSSERPLSFPPEHGGPHASWDAAEPIASARYVAIIGPTSFGQPRPRIAHERGRYRCADAERPADEDSRAGADSSCPDFVRAWLAQTPAPGLLIVEDDRVLAGPPAQWTTFFAPIDSPAKALVVVYGRSLQYGDVTISPEYAAVEPVEGGFDVTAGVIERDMHCGQVPHPPDIERDYEVVYRVRRDGAFEERSRRLVARVELRDACHPL